MSGQAPPPRLPPPEEDEPLPPEPDRPDCCNSGCAVCVLDGFEEEMQAWRRQVAAILERRARRRPAAE